MKQKIISSIKPGVKLKQVIIDTEYAKRVKRANMIKELMTEFKVTRYHVFRDCGVKYNQLKGVLSASNGVTAKTIDLILTYFEELKNG